MSKQIETGTIVRLRSGGPRMLVEGFDDDNKAYCIWFDCGGNRQSYFFAVTSLESTT